MAYLKYRTKLISMSVPKRRALLNPFNPSKQSKNALYHPILPPMQDRETLTHRNPTATQIELCSPVATTDLLANSPKVRPRLLRLSRIRLAIFNSRTT